MTIFRLILRLRLKNFTVYNGQIFLMTKSMPDLAQEFRLAWSSPTLFRELLTKIENKSLSLVQLEKTWKLKYPNENMALFLQSILKHTVIGESILNKFCTSFLKEIREQLTQKNFPIPLGYEVVIVVQDFLSPGWDKLFLLDDVSKKRKRATASETKGAKRRKISSSQKDKDNLKKNLENLNYNAEQIKAILHGKRTTVETLIMLHSQLHETLDHESITSLTKGGSTALESYLIKNQNLQDIGYTQEEIVKIGSHTGAPERYSMLEKYSEELINRGFLRSDVILLLCGKAYKAPELLIIHFDKLIELYSTPQRIMNMVKREGINFLRALLKTEQQEFTLLVQDDPVAIEIKDEQFAQRKEVKHNPFSFYASHSGESSSDSLSFSEWNPSL